MFGTSLLKSRRDLWGLLLAVLICPGCGGADAVVKTPGNDESNRLSSVDQLKTRLTGINESGQAGSATEGLGEAIDGLSVDESKKAALKKDLAELNVATDPEKIKAISKRMLEKL
jgi:hypothetical protein